MKFTQLLNESYYKTQKSSSTSPIEIFKNPSTSEIKQIIKSSRQPDFFKGVRIAVDNNTDLYMWDISVLHSLVKVPQILGLYYDYDEPQIISTDTVIKDDWDKFKNKNKLIKKLKSLFPKIKRIELQDHLINL